MDNAFFSIVNYHFDKVFIDLENYKSSELNLRFQPSGVFFSETSTFELTFEVQISQDEEKESFVKIRCKGFFKFEDIISFQEIPHFFYVNSIAILFPYVRAYLSLITTQANIKGIILPTLNLSSLEGELRKNTIQK